MNVRRAALGLVGLATVGGFVLTGGTVSGLVPVGNAVDLLGNDYLVVAVVGAVGLVLAASLLVSGRPGNVDETTTPDPERAVSLPVPGDDFDDAMSSRLALLPLVGGTDRATLRARLRSTVVYWLMRSENCTRTEAERRVEAGEWTDERDAALFLAADAGRRERTGAMLRSWVRLRPWLQVGARRTAAALVAASEEVGQAPTAGAPAAEAETAERGVEGR